MIIYSNLKSQIKNIKLGKNDQSYKRLRTKEREKGVYKLAKEREKHSRDFKNVGMVYQR